jgi:SAM-dependent methyltransferase
MDIARLAAKPTLIATQPMSARSKVEDCGRERILELGCGFNKVPGAYGVDIIPGSQADLIHDLNIYPYPFKDSCWDRIVCLDVLEHVENFVKTVEEIWRIASPNATVEISGPFMSSVHFYTDPTHRRALTSRSFDYFCPDRPLYRYGYTKAQFQMVSCEYDRGAVGSRTGLARLLTAWANKNKDKYEERYAFWYPMLQVDFTLRALK